MVAMRRPETVLTSLFDRGHVALRHAREAWGSACQRLQRGDVMNADDIVNRRTFVRGAGAAGAGLLVATRTPVARRSGSRRPRPPGRNPTPRREPVRIGGRHGGEHLRVADAGQDDRPLL